MSILQTNTITQHDLIKNMIYEFVTEINQLKAQNQALLSGNQSKEKDLFLKPDIENLLESYLSEYGLTYELSLILTPYLENTINSKDECELTEDFSKVLSQNVSIKKYEPNTKNRIGYCKIENGQHFICFDDNCEVILGLDEKTYLQDDQFVMVDENNNFKWSYRYLIVDSHEPVKEFLYISYTEGKLNVLNADGVIVKVELPKFQNFKEGQIISVDDKGEFIRYYKIAKFCYENYEKSFKSRNYRVSTPIEIRDSSIIFEDFDSKEHIEIDYFISDALKFKIEKESVVVLNSENQIINVIKNSYFLENQKNGM